MAPASTKAAAMKWILEPVTTLEGHGRLITSLSYFPDGMRMISGSVDKTTRQWDLKAGKEIEGARDVCEQEVFAVAVSQDGRWVVTGGGSLNTVGSGELKACEVETGIIKTLKGHSDMINCIDISADSTLLATGSVNETTQIWNLETGKLLAGSFKSIGPVGTVRFSPDSKKVAVELDRGTCLDVWDVQSQKLDVRIGKHTGRGIARTPIFWTNKNKTIIAAFEFNFTADSDLNDFPKTIYEFDAITLDTVGAPFEGHTNTIVGLALSVDGALLASASYHDETIKLWAFESRQVLASFDVQNVIRLIFSPDSRQLGYVINTEDDWDHVHKICICDTPPNVLAQARVRISCTHLLFVIIILTDYCTQNFNSQGYTKCAHLILLLIIPLSTHPYHCSLMQLVVLLLGTADHQYLPYLFRRDLRLQEICHNPLSLASANSFTSLLALMQYVTVGKMNPVIP
jgi:WD40 repeat protein